MAEGTSAQRRRVVWVPFIAGQYRRLGAGDLALDASRERRHRLDAEVALVV
jgi:hypothetical protein